MSAISKSEAIALQRVWKANLAANAASFSAAILFVALLWASYGLDLSPGLF